MKEGINLASPYQKKSFTLEKISTLSLDYRPLTKTAVGLSVLLLGLILVSILLTLLHNRQLGQKTDLSQKLAQLNPKEKVVLTAVQRQKDLELIKEQKKDFWSTTQLIKENLPEDTVLRDLTLNNQKTSMSAQTPTGSSFSQFVANLIGTRACRQISLTSSSYSQRQNLFSFGLECLRAKSVN